MEARVMVAVDLAKSGTHNKTCVKRLGLKFAITQKRDSENENEDNFFHRRMLLLVGPSTFRQAQGSGTLVYSIITRLILIETVKNFLDKAIGLGATQVTRMAAGVIIVL